MLSRFHLIPERHGQTNGRTDGIDISISRLSVLTRAKSDVVSIFKMGIAAILDFRGLIMGSLKSPC